MLTGSELEAHNKRFSDACADARVWLAEQLRAKGFACNVVEHAVVTSKTSGNNEESASVSIHIDYRPFSREAGGIKLKVNRQRHSITYRRKDTNWKEFNWAKIVSIHLAELEDRIKRSAQWLNEHNLQTRMQKLAKKEVWLPEGRFVRFGETAINGRSLEFTRHRKEDGSYRVNLSGDFTLEETLQLRDIAIAAHNRSGEKPIVVPENENTEKAAS